MFDLETAISHWRKQIVAAGVKSPALLEELESHLREDIAQQMHAGGDARRALENAVARMGGAKKLGREFGRARGSAGRSPWVNQVLGMLWLAGCGMSVFTVWRQSSWAPESFPLNQSSYFTGMATAIYLFGICGSVFLLCGIRPGAGIIRMMALGFGVLCVAQLLDPGMAAGWKVWCLAVAIFCVITVGLLHSPRRMQGNRTQ